MNNPNDDYISKNEIVQIIDKELEDTLREYVGGLRPQIIESYYEGYRDALKKVKKEMLKWVRVLEKTK